MLDGFRFVLESFYMKTIIIFLMMTAGVWAGEDDFIKKIRETRIKNGCDENPLMSNFCAAVYDGPGPIIIIDSETAVTIRGLINRSGDVYNTPEGTTIKAENVWLGPNGRITIEALESFIRNKNRGVSARNGQVYVGTGRTAIVSGGSVFKTTQHK
jgi:hypothetical protein